MYPFCSKREKVDDTVEVFTPILASVDPLTPTIFHEPWWLDIATEGRYGVAEVAQDGKTIGRLPYFLFKKMGLSIVDMPPLTHFMGPAVVESSGKPNSRFLHRIDVTSELIRKLPRTAAHYIKCHRDVTDVIAFQAAGFRASVQFTHEIYPQPQDVIWNNLRDKARNFIRTSRQRFFVTTGDDPSAFMDFYRKSFENRGQINNKNTIVCARLIGESMNRKCGRIYEARDDKGVLDAAIFCAWDRTSSYFLLSSRNLDAHFGATGLLVWEAILEATQRGLIFDFDGVSLEGCARFANQFTAAVAPRYIALRESVPMRIIRAVKSLREEKSCFY